MLRLPETLCLANLEENMIHIPGGRFVMGGEGPIDNTVPEHLVTLKPFELCRYPVSQKLWQEVMGESPKHLKFQNPHRPVERISWMMITNAFFTALNQKTGDNNYCLPSEAQWEYVGKGASQGKILIKSNLFEYSGSNDFREVSWASENSFGESHPLGLKRPNSLGLADMSGNIWEWCVDWYSRNYYQTLNRQYGEWSE
ncbi:MAG: formylglycine-generating enzyme family protein [Bacteroidota bacterium]